MAVTKIKAITSTLDKALKYICSPQKTQGGILIDSLGCVPEFAVQQMEATAKKNKRGGCRKAYHLIQSFAPDDDITPEKAMEIGRQFADQVTMRKHEYVITVHTDCGHIHCHIIFNAVDNTKEHAKYRYKGNSERDRIREISDQLCRDNNLSVLPKWTKGKKGRGHSNCKQHEKSWKDKLGDAIDRVVLESETFEDFITMMEAEEGYTFKNGKSIAFLAEAEGQKKYTRCDTIGDDYTEEMIRDRIANKEKYKMTDKFARGKYGRKGKNIPGSVVQKKADSPVKVTKKGARKNIARKINLISDLSQNIKAQNAPGYKYVAEKNNLNMLVKTMNYLTENDIETPERFQKFYESCCDEVKGLNKRIHETDLAIAELTEKRYHIRKYFKYLKFHNTFLKYKSMNYYSEHKKELQEFELSRMWLERNGVNPREYKAEKYQEEYSRLKSEKDALNEQLQPAKSRLYDTRNVLKNVESVLGIKIYEIENDKETAMQNDRKNTQEINKKER